MTKFDIITIFPNMVEAIMHESILKRGQDKGILSINVVDLRKYTVDKRKTVDDKPFGGGPGMLMLVEPIYKALKDLNVYPKRSSSTKIVLTVAGGLSWNQQLASSFAQSVKRLVIICGHYEGVDHRVSEHLIDSEISIGNYVLTGGELAAGVIVDSVARLIPGVVGNEKSLSEESYTDRAGREYPQYTRPAEFKSDEGETWTVPEILRSGHHQAIKDWQSSTI